MMCETFPITLIYIRVTLKAVLVTGLPAASVILGVCWAVQSMKPTAPRLMAGVSLGGVPDIVVDDTTCAQAVADRPIAISPIKAVRNRRVTQSSLPAGDPRPAGQNNRGWV